MPCQGERGSQGSRTESSGGFHLSSTYLLLHVASGQNFLTVNLQYTSKSKTLMFFEFDLLDVELREDTLLVEPIGK